MALNWDAFTNLPGAEDTNFELLCRALIRRHYAQFGTFAARAAQPGVEFHLQVTSKCSLGDPGRWYGWQCRWYDLPSGRAIGSTRRRKIKEALEKTAVAVPGTTDWVLWTRHPLTAGDQRWLASVPTKMKIHQWTSAEVESHLSGPGEIYRGTFFGELVLSPTDLEELHRRSVAPVQRRWRPEIHQPTSAERALRRDLVESDRWDDITVLLSRLKQEISTVREDLRNIPLPLKPACNQVLPHAKEAFTSLSISLAALKRGDIDFLRQQIQAFPSTPSDVLNLQHRLRGARHRASPTVANLISSIRNGRGIVKAILKSLETRSVAIVADAGCGKTHLSAEITAPKRDVRPAGILLLGNNLHSSHNLDDLARAITIQGTPVRSMEALIAAVDAAGQRAGRRLPIIIDGLNEAEDPRRWKVLLAPINEILSKYSHVIFVCTVRGAFADESLPPDIQRIEVPGFDGDTSSAIQRYFNYYKIDAADADLPTSMLSHPLTLQLFCEVTNPRREKTVGVEAMPGSLTGLFERYLEQAIKRIAELSPSAQRFYAQDVTTALDVIATVLWDEKTREIDLAALRRRLGDDTRPWDKSMARALEQEGVLLRAPSDAPTVAKVLVSYDALAGHLVATSIISKVGVDGLKTWIKDPSNITLLSGNPPGRHPLGGDTCYALAGVLPRRLQGQQLWKLADGPIRSLTIRYAANLESVYLDADTVLEIEKLARHQPLERRTVLMRSWSTRGSLHHPLNSKFLDRLLRPLGVAERDLFWTEWLRKNQEGLTSDLRSLQDIWRHKKSYDERDQLRARWVMWTLTSTIAEVRDNATCALYWFGRLSAQGLFELTLESLSLNDLYVPQRMLAVTYGVALAYQLPSSEFEKSFTNFIRGLEQALSGATATHPTNDWLARLYVENMIQFARKFYSKILPSDFKSGPIVFAPAPAFTPIEESDPRAKEMDSTMHMDFENYTLGGLFSDRGNYDMKHAGHKAAVSYVRGTAWDLGWRQDGLGPIDSQLLDWSRGNRPKTERYGKKYSWIGFYTYAGILSNAGKLSIRGPRLSELQIDPSFPEEPPPSSITLPPWAAHEPKADSKWVKSGKIPIPKELLYRSSINSHNGPWLLVNGHLSTKDQSPRRKAFGLLSALLVNQNERDLLIKRLSAEEYLGNFYLPREPDDHYTFAGEIPWSAQFAQSDPNELYTHSMDLAKGNRTRVEILAHRHAWEDYHSSLNRAGSSAVPSKTFSMAFDLRGLPQTFNQALPDGSLGAICESAPVGFEGHLLYLREDLIRRFAAGRALILTAWGERELHHLSIPSPDWYSKIRQHHLDLWRSIRKAEIYSSALKPSPIRKR